MSLLRHRLPRLLTSSTLLLALGAVAPLSTAQAQPAPPSPAASDQADTLFKQGNELYKQRKWKPAYEKYKAAFALKQSYDIAGNLGDVELTLGRARDAAEHLEYSYRSWPTGKQEARQRTLERLNQAKKLVGALTITVNVDGAEVVINDVPVGRTPLGHDVYVEPGAANISVSAPGHTTATKTVPLDKGESRELSIELEPDGSAGAGGAGAGGASAGGTGGAPAGSSGGDDGTGGSTTVTTDGMSGKTVALIAGGALTAVSAATWIGFYFAQKSSADDANSLVDQINSELGPNGCGSQPDHSLCTNLADKNDSGKTQKTLSIVGGVGTVVFVAATAGVWFLWPDSKEKSAKSTQWSPTIARDRFGVTVTGSF